MNAPTTTDQPALTPAAAQAELGISRRTLMRWEERGYISPTRLPSGHRRFDPVAVAALKESGRQL